MRLSVISQSIKILCDRIRLILYVIICFFLVCVNYVCMKIEERFKYRTKMVLEG